MSEKQLAEIEARGELALAYYWYAGMYHRYKDSECWEIVKQIERRMNVPGLDAKAE